MSWTLSSETTQVVGIPSSSSSGNLRRDAPCSSGRRCGEHLVQPLSATRITGEDEEMLALSFGSSSHHTLPRPTNRHPTVQGGARLTTQPVGLGVKVAPLVPTAWRVLGVPARQGLVDPAPLLLLDELLEGAGARSRPGRGARRRSGRCARPTDRAAARRSASSR